MRASGVKSKNLCSQNTLKILRRLAPMNFSFKVLKFTKVPITEKFYGSAEYLFKYKNYDLTLSSLILPEALCDFMNTLYVPPKVQGVT